MSRVALVKGSIPVFQANSKEKFLFVVGGQYFLSTKESAAKFHARNRKGKALEVEKVTKQEANLLSKKLKEEAAAKAKEAKAAAKAKEAEVAAKAKEAEVAAKAKEAEVAAKAKEVEAAAKAKQAKK